MTRSFRSPRLRRLAAVAGFAGMAACGTPGPIDQAWAGDPAGTVLITTAPARQGSLPDIVTAYGMATPAQNGGMAVSLQQDGRVSAILVTQGERVVAGTTLLSFDVAAASISAYSQAVTALSLAQSQRGHTAELLAQHLATRDQLAQADKAVSDAHATLAALIRQGASRPRIEVTAPFDAIVEAIPVAQGDRVAAGATLLTLTRLDGLVVTVGVDSALFARLRAGQAARLKAMNGQVTLSGRVLRVDGVVNAKTRLLDVDISVPPGSVVSGTQFQAAITVGALSGWVVPHDAVLDDEHGYFLFQVDAAKAVRRDVKLLATRAAEDVVQGKLDSRLAVVLDGATQLADGDPVRLADMPGAAGPAR